MGPISRWAVFNPKKTVGIWLALIIAIFALAGAAKGVYNTSFSLPDTESSRAQTLLTEKFGALQTGATADVVFSPVHGTVDDPAVRKAIEGLVTSTKSIPGVTGVVSPFDKAPDGTASTAVSQDRTVAYVTVDFAGEASAVAKTSVQALVADVLGARSDTLTVGASGQVIQFANTDPPSSEGIGMIAAFVILLFTFGSLVAAGLPLITAIVALGTGLSLVSIIARFMDIATFAPTLAAMIGLGVGIDYALFIINRYRQALASGKEPREAAVESVNTAGRAVLFAGSTVIIALMGLFVVGINFLNGLAVAAAVTVLMTMFTALTLLPAVLAWLGRRTFAVRMPWARTPRPHDENHGFGRHAQTIQRRPWLFAGGALALMVLVATPVLSMRLGFADDGGSPVGSVERTAYDLMAKGFGPGSNGPFIVVAELPKTGDLTPATALSKALGAAEGVAFAGAPVADKAGDTVLITVIPKSAPQDEATGALLERLRGTVIPEAIKDTGITASVGGAQAITQDFGSVISGALPLFLTVVISLGILALMVLFRSIVVPLTAAATSLLSLGAAMGAVVAIFQWGWLSGPLGVTATGPIAPFLPVMLFAILFGLSMDYQVFLVSRMQEEWMMTGDNRLAVRRGLSGSGRVVMAAAAIMTSVFIAFAFGDNATIKLFGIGLATAVFLDAFVVRLVLVPALMTLFGSANWWLPSFLADRLPTVSVEHEVAAIAELSDDLEDIPVP